MQPLRNFLFLQGPISPFFTEVATALEARGHSIFKINLCFGDYLFWRRKGATNYRKGKNAWPEFIQTYLKENEITDIVLLGEQRFYHKAAIAAAKEQGIAITVTDFGYLRPDWITLEKDGMSGSSLFPKDALQIHALAKQSTDPDLTRHFEDSFWTMAVWDMVYHLSSTLFHLLYPGYRTHQMHHPILVYLGTGLRLLKGKLSGSDGDEVIGKLKRDKTSYFLFPLQMATDFQIRAYSDYPDQQTAIDEVIRSFANNAPLQAKLVVKIHPLDPGLVNWKKQVQKYAIKHKVDDRVVFLDGGDLETLLSTARGVVTINSTVGLWALRSGCPVKSLGQAIYNIEGLIYKEPLDSFWNNTACPDSAVVADFFRAMAGTIQIRGVFYRRPGLDHAVEQTVERLDKNIVNQLIT